VNEKLTALKKNLHMILLQLPQQIKEFQLEVLENA